MLERATERAGGANVVQRRKLSGPDLLDSQGQALKRFVSPDLAYKAYKGDPAGAAERYLTKAGKDHDAEDIGDIAGFLSGYTRPTDYWAVVTELTAGGGKPEYAEELRRLWRAVTAKPPSIVWIPTLTMGNYDTDRHVIALDPAKNADATTALDTLLFETQNALQRSALKPAIKSGVGRKVAEVEYESDKRYVASLTAVHRAKSIDDLVSKLGIDPKYLTDANYATCKRAGKVERPPRTELAEQDKRQALWWWKTRRWSDDQRKELWIAEEHGEGVGSSTSLYQT